MLLFVSSYRRRQLWRVHAVPPLLFKRLLRTSGRSIGIRLRFGGGDRSLLFLCVGVFLLAGVFALFGMIAIAGEQLAGVVDGCCCADS